MAQAHRLLNRKRPRKESARQFQGRKRRNIDGFFSELLVFARRNLKSVRLKNQRSGISSWCKITADGPGYLNFVSL